MHARSSIAAGTDACMCQHTRACGRWFHREPLDISSALYPEHARKAAGGGSSGGGGGGGGGGRKSKRQKRRKQQQGQGQ